MTRLQRFCQRCIRNATRGRNNLCEECKASGWRWCNHAKHAVPQHTYYVSAGRCAACCNARNHIDQIRRKNGGRYDVPPAGYVLLGEAAKRLHYSRNQLGRLCRTGKINAWKRNANSPWYVEVSR